jgi:hypothetical protein
MRKNILLFILVLTLSLATASYFGVLYDYFVPQSGASLLGVSKDTAVSTAGIFFAYMIILPFIFELFGLGNKNKWILILLAPVILFYISDNLNLVYIPILASFSAFILAKLINFIISKFRKSVV